MTSKIPLISFTFGVSPRSIFSGEWEIVHLRQLRPSGWNCSCLLPGAVSRQSTCAVLAMLTVDELWSRNHTRTSPIPLCWFFSLNFPGSGRFSACYFPGWKPLYLKRLLTPGKAWGMWACPAMPYKAHNSFRELCPPYLLDLCSCLLYSSFSLLEVFSLISKLSLKFPI